MHNSRVWRNGHPNLVRKRNTCTIEGCDSPVVGRGFCTKHWHRWRKWGDPNYVAPMGRKRSSTPVLNSNGYLVIQNPEHPLAMKGGQLLVHRQVLYDAIGPGPHACEICGVELEWRTSDRRRRLAVDHIDNNILNNDLSNLRPTCQPCNVKRPHALRTACNAGHEYTPENTYVDPNGSRRCRTCMRAYDRKRRPPGTPR